MGTRPTKMKDEAEKKRTKIPNARVIDINSRTSIRKLFTFSLSLVDFNSCDDQVNWSQFVCDERLCPAVKPVGRYTFNSTIKP